MLVVYNFSGWKLQLMEGLCHDSVWIDTVMFSYWFLLMSFSKTWQCFILNQNLSSLRGRSRTKATNRTLTFPHLLGWHTNIFGDSCLFIHTSGRHRWTSALVMCFWSHHLLTGFFRWSGDGSGDIYPWFDHGEQPLSLYCTAVLSILNTTIV